MGRKQTINNICLEFKPARKGPNSPKPSAGGREKREAAISRETLEPTKKRTGGGFKETIARKKGKISWGGKKTHRKQHLGRWSKEGTKKGTAAMTEHLVRSRK